MSAWSAEETVPIFGAHSGSPDQEPIWKKKKDRTIVKMVVGAFLGFVVLNLLVSIILACIQAGRENKLYILLLVSLLAFSQVEFFVVFFIYKEYISAKHFYAVFIIGIAIIIECLSTNILVFSAP